jgi:Zn-dependent protease
MGATGSFRLLGFPLRVDPALFVVLLVLVTSAHVTRSVLIAFVVGGAVSVIAHELGHAVAAKSLGASSVSISLQSYGGLTKYTLHTATRTKVALIAAAGPAVGLALGLWVWIAEQAAAPVPGSEQAATYRQLLFVTAGWSVINLLPVVPLDGGRLLEQLLPGTAQDRARAAGMISIVSAALACMWFWQRHELYPAVVFGVLTAYSGVYAILGLAPGSGHRHTPSCTVFAKACAGDYAGAADAARQLSKPDAALAALLPAVMDNDTAAQARLYAINERHPEDLMARSCLMLLRAHLGDWPGILAMLRGRSVKLGAMTAAFDAAYKAHAFAEAANIGERFLQSRDNSLIAYNTACCWARAGNPDLALSALMRAVTFGWCDWAQIDNDEDLATVRVTPGFQSWRLTFPVAA